jgi:hypothetical protein
MKILIEAKEESEILAAVEKDATPEEIRESLEVRAESCVNHLCGCS